MQSALNLLYPEWQGYGESNSVFHGANLVVANLFHGREFKTIEVPTEEKLIPTAGVVGLSSIVSRFGAARQYLLDRSPSKVLTIGGTCGVEVAPVSYLNSRYAGDLAVLWFDAHGDLNTPMSSPSGHFHGMVLRSLLGDGPVEYVSQLPKPLVSRQIFLVGTRELDPPEAEFITTSSISVTPPESLKDGCGLVEEIAHRGFKNLYIHLDLDVLNPTDFPDSLMQTVGGPTRSQLAAVLKLLCERFNVVGFSIVEFVKHSDFGIEKLRELIEQSGITTLI